VRPRDFYRTETRNTYNAALQKHLVTYLARSVARLIIAVYLGRDRLVRSVDSALGWHAHFLHHIPELLLLNRFVSLALGRVEFHLLANSANRPTFRLLRETESAASSVFGRS
jgi:hypothetical protein